MFGVHQTPQKCLFIYLPGFDFCCLGTYSITHAACNCSNILKHIKRRVSTCEIFALLFILKSVPTLLFLIAFWLSLLHDFIWVVLFTPQMFNMSLGVVLLRLKHFSETYRCLDLNNIIQFYSIQCPLM